MKKIYFTISMCMLMFFTASAQTATLSPTKDSWTCDATSTTNYGTAIELVVADWTSGGEYKCRTFLEFDFSSIPAGATITSAYLKLYTANPSVYAPAGNSGDNKTYIQRVTSLWTESGITWSNSPSATSTNQIEVGATTSADHVFDINVTDMVADMYANPSQNFGFCMKLQDESTYRNFALISKENSDNTKHPKLTINYTTTTGINQLSVDNNRLLVSPNPSNSVFNITFDRPFTGLIVDMNGKTIHDFISTNSSYVLNVSEFSKGLYFIILQTENGVCSKKVMVE